MVSCGCLWCCVCSWFMCTGIHTHHACSTRHKHTPTTHYNPHYHSHYNTRYNTHQHSQNNTPVVLSMLYHVVHWSHRAPMAHRALHPLEPTARGPLQVIWVLEPHTGLRVWWGCCVQPAQCLCVWGGRYSVFWYVRAVLHVQPQVYPGKCIKVHVSR